MPIEQQSRVHHKALNISMTCTVIYSIVELTHDPLRLYGISTLRFVRDTSTLLYEALLRVYLCQPCGVHVKDQMSSAGNPSAEFAGHFEG